MPILDLTTPEGWKAELTYVVGYNYILWWLTSLQTVTHPSSNRGRCRQLHWSRPTRYIPGRQTVVAVLTPCIDISIVTVESRIRPSLWRGNDGGSLRQSVVLISLTSTYAAGFLIIALLCSARHSLSLCLCLSVCLSVSVCVCMLGECASWTYLVLLRPLACQQELEKN